MAENYYYKVVYSSKDKQFRVINQYVGVYYDPLMQVKHLRDGYYAVTVEAANVELALKNAEILICQAMRADFNASCMSKEAIHKSVSRQLIIHKPERI